MIQAELFYRFGIALGIGILIGLQREHAHHSSQKDKAQQKVETVAGVRTFALIALVGCLSAYLADKISIPLLFVGLIAPVAALIVIAYYLSGRRGDIGMTTEIAAMITLLTGALCYWGDLLLAAAIGVATTVLLSLKLELHQFARQLTREDIYATLKFSVITIIILPLLPNQPIGQPPFDVLNLYKIWLMVVFISGISFLGYILIKLVGSRQGIALSGLLGGLVSSTAVTLTFSQRSRSNSALVGPFALGIIIAWAVMFARILLEVGVINRPLLAVLWLPITAGGVVGLAYGGYLYWADHSDEQSNVEVSNPFELGPAITFALLYAIILFVSNLAQSSFGNTGLYLSSILSGLADVDAITLSMAELSQAGGTLDLSTASRAIVLAAMSNTVVKGSIVLASGAVRLRKTILPAFVMILVVSLSTAFLLV